MNSEDNKNFILAIVLSLLVLIGWNAFVASPRIESERQRRAGQEQAEKSTQIPGVNEGLGTGTQSGTQTGTGVPGTRAAGQPPLPPAGSGGSGGAIKIGTTRDAALANTPRIRIETPSLSGSMTVTGARIDDLRLTKYRQTTDPESEPVVLFSPSGSPKAYYAEYGWAEPGKVTVGSTTPWQREGSGPLTPASPVTLTWDDGAGLKFRRTISIDDDYMFTVRQEVENTSNVARTLYPYALISRNGKPKVAGIFILHEGLLGFLGKLRELDYDDVEDQKLYEYKETGGWLGFTDKYWSATLIPAQGQSFTARFKATQLRLGYNYQADYSPGAVAVLPGATQSLEGRLFAGAKNVEIINAYEENLKIPQYNLMIDWGWFHFITRPLYQLLSWLYGLVGNYGVAILLATVLVKLVFFPLANKSYVSMGKMKKLQPEMEKIRERFPDDRARQQQSMMELYKKEKINPLSGCLPILLQIPVFFALYKVLFVSIDMRHAPFFGWINDLSSPDPTSLFNFFGLLPFDVPTFLTIGVWPLLMGISMWLQMKLNPAPTDPIQAKIFGWMPVFFTFLLASFPAGLVIYWTWNNILSISQQWFIMSRQGVKIQLLDNVKQSFSWINRLKGNKAADES